MNGWMVGRFASIFLTHVLNGLRLLCLKEMCIQKYEMHTYIRVYVNEICEITNEQHTNIKTKALILKTVIFF